MGTDTQEHAQIRLLIGAGCIVAGIVLLLFLPAQHYEFLGYDDSLHVLDTPSIRALNVANLKRMFWGWSTTSYYPVRVLSEAIDWAIWQENPRGYHLTNVLLHGLNAVLLWAWLLRCLRRASRGGSEPAAAGKRAARAAPERGARGFWTLLAGTVGALLFGVHPIVVESVASIGAREELLMVLFGLLALHAYLTARCLPTDSGKHRLALVAAALFCLLACLSNVLGATVPALIWACDACLLREPEKSWPDWVRATLLRTWPMLLMAIAAVLLKLKGNALPHPQRYADADRGIGAFNRLLVVLDCYAANLRKFVWPKDLIMLYPNRVPEGLFRPGPFLGLVLMAGTGALLWRLRRRRVTLFALGFVLIGLLPSAQIIPHHIYQADRFLYLPMCGMALLAAAALGAVPNGTLVRAGTLSACSVALIALGMASARHREHFKNDVTAYGRSVAIAPLSWMAHNNLGVAYGERGRIAESVYHLSEALRMTPDYAQGHNNMANALIKQNQHLRAIAHLKTALQILPDYPNAHFNIARAYSALGRKADAARHYSEVLRLDPTDAEAREALRWSHAIEHKSEDSLEELRAAVKKSPDDPRLRLSLAGTLLRMEKNAEAVAHYSAALRLAPGQASIHSDLGIALGRLKRNKQARQHFRAALRADPNHAQAHYNLGNLLARERKVDEALACYSRAVALAPNEPKTHAKLGAGLLVKGRPKEAITHFSRALELNPYMDDVRRMLDEALWELD